MKRDDGKREEEEAGFIPYLYAMFIIIIIINSIVAFTYFKLQRLSISRQHVSSQPAKDDDDQNEYYVICMNVGIFCSSFYATKNIFYTKNGETCCILHSYTLVISLYYYDDM